MRSKSWLYGWYQTWNKSHERNGNCKKDDLTMFLTSRESTCLTARKMLDVMSEYEDEMDRSQNTDLCVLLVVKNCDYMTCEIVASLIDFIFEKKHVCLQRFSFLDRLFCLNCKFDVYSNVVEIKDYLNVIFSDFIKMYLKHLNVAPHFYTKRLTNEFVKSWKS